ncbi:hypothetical protein P152DRAFT_459054 [Eremomyces bilateralis CBS 781.70]|uniref:Pre-rRNA-processing protein RIX1 N-terminal domain-containing protein n=1 Tax=Eremomyces bilateralis CBS 781.70 TaxID=1392243 RepID=A0A6G1G252_9PEZI|nr:uncharacterized protein P152DRAFT_459054 [Eremomyces bilateralis CBS 781.70]KAF1812098.1 hypothetical protein P152DRAFT_459054 [Eremomyces bilateralis CBS 781.70]
MASNLRTITYRLSSTPKHLLPRIAPQLVSFLAESKDAIAFDQGKGSELSILAHKLRTQLSALLQEKSVHSRWTALVLIKTYLEIGEWDAVEKSASWVRGVLQHFQRPNPLSVKHLCVLILSRVFLLSQGHQTFIREVVTPSLSAFATACLDILGTTKYSPNFTRQNDLFQSVLSCLGELIPNHATSFRPFETKLRGILKGIAFNDTVYIAESTRQKAVDFLVELHRCAPRSAGAEERKKAVKTYVTEIHDVLSILFRGVGEEHQQQSAQKNGFTSLEDDPLQDDPTPAGLPGWSGITPGFDRGIRLLQLLRAYVAVPYPDAVDLRLGLVNDLLARILSMKGPGPGEMATWEKAGKFNSAVSMEEMNELFAQLPLFHLAAIDIVLSISKVLGTASSSVMARTAEDLNWLFTTKAPSSQLRRAAYDFLSAYIRTSGPALSKDSISDLAPVMKSCCSDLVRNLEAPSQEAKSNGAPQIEAFTTSKQRQGSPKELDADLYHAAYKLLPRLFSLPSKYVASSLRVHFDQAALLLLHEEALCLSAANPPAENASILPLARRLLGSVDRLDTLTRPRQPVISSTSGTSDLDENQLPASNIDVQNTIRESRHGDPIITMSEDEPHGLAPEVQTTIMDESSDPMQDILLAQHAAMPSNGDHDSLPPDTARATKRHLEMEEEQSKRQRLDVQSLGTTTTLTSTSTVSKTYPVESGIDSEISSNIKSKAEQLAKPVATATPAQKAEAIQEVQEEQTSDDDSDFEIPPLTMNPDADLESD